MDSPNPESEQRADAAPSDGSSAAAAAQTEPRGAHEPATNGAPRPRPSRARARRNAVASQPPAGAEPPSESAAESAASTPQPDEPPKKKRTRRKAAVAPDDATQPEASAEAEPAAPRRRRTTRRPPVVEAEVVSAAEPEPSPALTIESVVIETVASETVSIETVSIEAVTIEPITMEALALEPAAIESVALEPVAIEPVVAPEAEHAIPESAVLEPRRDPPRHRDPALAESTPRARREGRPRSESAPRSEANGRAEPNARAEHNRESAPRGDAPWRGERAPEPSAAPLAGPKPTIHRRAFPSEHLDDDALKVLRRLHRHGYRAYLVGGCVRDLLLGRKAKDYDVATSARPHEVKNLFRNCRIIGRRFRLAHILFGSGKVIETATFRRDPTAGADEETFVAESEAPFDEAGSARMREAIESGEFDALPILRPQPKPRDDDADLLIRNDNVFGEPHEDALRRDFTINGLFYDVERGEVIDYVGGLRDLERRAINTIGLPDVRFREDPVRILRAIKFSARLDLGIDPDVYDAMVAQREELLKAAKPRLLEEILRLLRGGAAHRSIWLAWELGVLSVVLPELAVFLDDDAPRSRLLWGRLDAIDASVRAKRVPSDPVLLGALLLGPIEEALDGARDPSVAYEDFMHDVAESLAVPRRMKERMRAIIGSQRRLRAGRHAPLARRDFFAEAVQLYELECAARGQKGGELRADVERAEGDGETVVRRRRRRRSRR